MPMTLLLHLTWAPRVANHGPSIMNRGAAETRNGKRPSLQFWCATVDSMSWSQSHPARASSTQLSWRVHLPHFPALSASFCSTRLRSLSPSSSFRFSLSSKSA